MKSDRIELIFIENSLVSDLNIDLEKANIGTIYARVGIETISFTRQLLVDKGYSTRLIVIPDEENIFYIYGRKKASKAVFNEHCKNTVIRKDDYIRYLIEVSSNDFDVVATDNSKITKTDINRGWITI